MVSIPDPDAAAIIPRLRKNLDSDEPPKTFDTRWVESVLGRSRATGRRAAIRDLGERLSARGVRLTPQRVRILDAVRALQHATPDGLAAAVGR
jgi:hypothetical protein